MIQWKIHLAVPPIIRKVGVEFIRLYARWAISGGAAESGIPQGIIV